MKNKVLLTVVFAFSVALNTFAFYDPSIGRWASRDPLGEWSFLRVQLRRDPARIHEFWLESLKPSYVFVSNDPSDAVDSLGLDVYKVQLPSSVSGSVDHRQIIGDDGKGGCYVLEFYPKHGGACCSLFGATLAGKGEIAVQNYKKQSAVDYINSNGLTVVEAVATSNVYFYPSGESVDSLLAGDADGFGKSSAPNYILLYNDCGTIANSWLKHANDVLNQANDSAPQF